jgi:pimeloyl-ACP methyl ester carboxylesterase
MVLDGAFLTNIVSGNQGVLLFEGRQATTQPLVLEVWQGTDVLASASLYLSITGVEQMFRHKNLIHETFSNPDSAGAPADRLTDADVPNEPDTNDKNFVFVHGYNVNPVEARGRAADVFKRVYWSGSHARFWAVTWDGSQSQGHLIPGVTCNFHTNVVNAFLTAPKLAAFLGTLTNEPTVVAAHSLGSMVALSALSDWNAPIGKYFMIDAAVAIEAVQGSAPQTNSMIYSDWLGYTNRLFAREWHALFGPGDARSTLSWTNRLANFHNTEVYNFYSSGEEVLRNDPSDPPSGVLSALVPQLFATIKGAMGAYAWVWQEKGKGRGTFNDYIASNHGGWGWNKYEDQYYWHTNGGDGGMEVVQLDPASAARLPDEQLRTNAFFDMSLDTALFTTSSSGSDYALANRNRILADAIPALTLPIGANPVPAFDPIHRNFDMQTTYENGWPSGRRKLEVGNTPAFGEWHHGDFRQVAYTFNYGLYDAFVNFGNLR